MLSERGFRAAYPGREPRNTDDRPILEYAAPKAFFLAREAEALFRFDERRRVREAKPGAGP